MLVKPVSLNSAGHPYIKVKVYGISEQFAKEFDALIDTGFTGFMLLPLTDALPLGLTLVSTTTYTLGDGSSTFSLLAFGTVVFEDQSVFGPISLELNTNCEGAILGMDYIRQSKQLLMLSSQGAALLDMPALQKQFQEIEEQLKEKAAPEPDSLPPAPTPAVIPSSGDGPKP